MLHVTEMDNRDRRTTDLPITVTIDPVEVFVNLIENNEDYYGKVEQLISAVYDAGLKNLAVALWDANGCDLDLSLEAMLEEEAERIRRERP